MYIPTGKSTFAGAGGMDGGMIEAGVNIIQSLEIDKTCAQTLRQNFGHTVLETDIKNVTVLDQPKTDVVIGTYPCTKYSTFANITGTRTGDDLFLHFFRHVALEQPEMYIIENVPGMKKFKVVMECFTKLPNYYVHVVPIDALKWLPQRRERLIVIGTKRPFTPSQPEFKKRITLKSIIEKDPDIHIPQYVYNRINGKYRDKPIVSDPNDINAYAPTCVAHYSRDLGTRMVKDKRFPHGVRPYTPLEYARLQGFPDHFKFAGAPSEIYKQIGNAVAWPMAKWCGEQVMRYFN